MKHFLTTATIIALLSTNALAGGNNPNNNVNIPIAAAGSKNDINIDGDNYAEIPANTAYAPTVIATSDCLGSLSAGGQGSGIGLSFGGTTQSKPCNVREFAKMNANNKDLFYAIQCQDPIVREAFKVTGDFSLYCADKKTYLGLKPIVSGVKEIILSPITFIKWVINA